MSLYIEHPSWNCYYCKKFLTKETVKEKHFKNETNGFASKVYCCQECKKKVEEKDK